MQPRQPEQIPLQKRKPLPPPPYNTNPFGVFSNGRQFKPFEAMTVKELARHKKEGFGPDPLEREHWQASWDKLTLIRPAGFVDTNHNHLLRPAK